MRAPIELWRAKVPFNNEGEAGGPQLHQPLAMEGGILEVVAGEDREALQNLVISKTTRMQKVIDREGVMTRYKYCYVRKSKYKLLKFFDRLSSLLSSS
jgi:hypothetical protein